MTARALRTAARRAAVALTAVALLAGCTSGKGAQGGFVGGDGTLTRIAVAERKPAPVLSGTDLEGRPLTTSTYAGKVVVLNVWGSWCAPCRKEAPALVSAASKLDGRAAFVGIATRDAEAAPALAFQRQFGVKYPSFHDPDGSLLLQLSGDVSPNAIPTTLVIDAQGRVAARILGEASEGTLVGMVTDVEAGK